MTENRRTLGELAPGERGRVYGVAEVGDRLRRRIVDMGITPGTEITVIKVAPMGDPIEIALRGYELSLRKEDALHIALMTQQEEARIGREARTLRTSSEREGRIILKNMEHGSDSDAPEHERAAKLTEFMLENEPYDRCAVCDKDIFPDGQAVTLALAGNPNSGKTTLFNALTGSREYVGNWPGVTVEKKAGKIKSTALKGDKCDKCEGICTHGHDMTLVDLPGIYSLSPYSMEEVVARDFIVKEKPDAIINIVDATNLERNLYLTIQLMELERPMIIALNMMDEVEKRGDRIDVKRLSLELGVPVVPISARTGMGIDELIGGAQKLLFAAHAQLHEGFRLEPDDLYDDYTHIEHHRIGAIIEPFAGKAGLPLHWAEIKLLENDKLVREALALPAAEGRRVDEIVERYSAANPLGDSETMIADSRYRCISSVCSAALKRASRLGQPEASSALDKILTNKFFAIPVFIVIMLAIFALTFGTLGAWLSDLVGELIGWSIPAVRGALEASGAMPWFTSLICDGIINGVGGVLTFLPQIALLFFFLSLLEDSGYMSRIAFIMDKPMRRFGLSGKSFIPLLMGFGCTVPASMGARATDTEKDKRMTILLLPFMSCSAKLPVYGLIAGAFFGKGRLLVILSLYALGILVGILSGFIFKKTLFKGEDAPFMLELPPYRWPSLKNALVHVWERVAHFLEKAATIILAMSVVLWFLQSFDFSFALTEDAANSILGRIGSFIAPVFTPMGFGVWQAAVALLTGVVAKEAVVSSLSLFYGFSVAAESGAVQGALASTFTPLAAYSFLVFVLLYTPCAAAVATMRRELNSGRLTAFAIAYQIGVAYIVSLLVYLIGSIFV